MTRRILPALLAVLGAAGVLVPSRAAAQERRVSPVISYGKWAVLGAAVGMNVLAARAHDRADDAFDRLRDLCFDDRARCAVGGDGRYADPVSESLYQESLRYDRRARGWLIGGEAALLGAAVMFVWELTRPKGPPENIPFEPEVTSADGVTRLGVRVGF